MKNQDKKFIKFLLDFLPVILFFAAYKIPLEGIKPITLASLVGGTATIIALLTARLLKIQLEKFALYSNIAFVIFAGLTVAFDNPNFIKAKLSILNGALGVFLIYCYFSKKLIIKSLFQGKILMNERCWNLLNLRFAIMFGLISLLNLYFWQFTSESTWVNFKTFGVLPFIFIFFFLQFRFILKNGTVIENNK
jgi:intracellular septation protein